ncbi:FAD-dependent monooxygenase [Nonomuraea roseoviolacea]|uniref:4,5-epoxidase n=1 Tax=Nonomuraea roseoviolacea subsp. carminata TaxID=160689 RepID=A0ABT1KAZ8_9ACTN|nr:FAD-dependent monooxygenase [Nonomuraea roseoviolacea]MCP2351197.1 4,5-epoxidase [Nonomuraea roseoviolacea subsp. carminata]
MTDTVLVVGAGPTGLALAIHLTLRDVPVRLIDAAPGPATTSRALGLQPRGAEVLERIGALGDLPERSQRSLTMSYNEGSRTVLRMRVGQAAADLPKQALLVSQAEVEGVLRRRLGELGGAVEWDTRLVAAEQDGAGVTVTVRTEDGAERQAETRWLIGCDGAHSTVRKLAGIGFPGRRLMERLLMADVRARWPFDRNGSTTWMDAGHMLSVTALPDDTWRIFTEPPADLPRDLPDGEIAERALAEFSRRSGVGLDTVTEIRWATEFRIHRRLADAYRRGRILLAGDAAHIQSPTGGQGQNTGLGDAENLAWKLVLVARGRADARLLDTYEGERRPLARNVLRATSTAVNVMLPDTAWKRLVRDRLVLPAVRLPAVQRRLWLAASQLGIGYRGGPLARTSHRWASGPRPGDRMPDLRCLDPGGEEVTLHAAVSARWVVLAADRRAADRHAEAAAARLGDGLVTALVPVPGAAEAAGVDARDVVLVRPDGHIGWRGRPAPDRLAAWIDEVLWPA